MAEPTLAADAQRHSRLVESPKSWSAAPETFLTAFRFTAHLVNGFAILAIFFSALRGGRRD